MCYCVIAVGDQTNNQEPKIPKIGTTETILKTISGLVQYFNSPKHVLAHYNGDGNLYAIRGDKLWHKSRNAAVGTIEIIRARGNDNRPEYPGESHGHHHRRRCGYQRLSDIR